MPEVNANDRASVERLYGPDEFEQDAARNSLQNAAVLHGLRIMSQPDEAGLFELTRAKQQTGERNLEGDTVFLAPFLASDAGSDLVAPEAAIGQGDPAMPDGAGREQRAGYAAFIGRVIEAARTAHFKTPIGRTERLKGFHGG